MRPHQLILRWWAEWDVPTLVAAITGANIRPALNQTNLAALARALDLEASVDVGVSNLNWLVVIH